MKRLSFTSFVVVICLLASMSQAMAQTSQQERLQQHVYTLAADSLNGRAAGSPDAARARNYIARQWRAMGLQPLSSGDSYEMPFAFYGQQGYCNLIAYIEGNDPVLKSEYIVVGGHYDHLGVRHGDVYNGADDNASGSACVIEVARQLLSHQQELKRSIIICAFDAEELGLYGSQSLVTTLDTMGLLPQVKLMMSIDMVGWYKAGKALTLQGTGTLADGKLLTDAHTLGVDIVIRRKSFENSIFTATDTEPFASRGIATLAVTTGLKSPYHKPGDDADLIDYEGLSLVTDYMAAFTLMASQYPMPLASGKVAAKHNPNPSRVEAGLTFGANRNTVMFPESAVTPKSLLGFSGGLALQYNFNNTVALHGEMLYSYSRCRLPEATDAYGNGYRLRQQSLLVPLTLQVGVRGRGMGAYLRAGGFFDYAFQGMFYNSDGQLPQGLPDNPLASPYRGGFVFGAGIRIGTISFDVISYYQIGNLFPPTDALPRAWNYNHTVSLSYWF